MDTNENPERLSIRERGNKAAEKLFGPEPAVVLARPLFSQRMLSFAGKVIGERLAIAQAVYDKVAEEAQVYMDNGYSAEVVAKIAQKAVLDAIEHRAHSAGLLGDVRD